MALLCTGSADILSADFLLQRGRLRSKAHAAGTAAVQNPCSGVGCGPKAMLRTRSADILSAGFSLQPGRLRSKGHAAGTAAVQWLCFALGARTFCPLVTHAAGTAAVQSPCSRDGCGPKPMQPGRLRSEAAAVQEGWGPSITTPWVGPPICVDWATLLLERCSFGCVFAVDSTMVSGTCATFLWQHS